MIIMYVLLGAPSIVKLQRCISYKKLDFIETLNE